MAEKLSIVHVDMDAFFAAVEQRDNPRLRGRPVIVGGRPDARGVVSAASYEARRYGVHSAMSAREARSRCPQAVFLPVDMDKYARVSREIHELMLTFTHLVEPLSLDEAYLDVGDQGGVHVGTQLKRRIGDEIGLTASVGVSYNKFLAKLASDMDKPDGFVVLTRFRAEKVLPGLSVERLWGVGHKTADLLRDLGMTTLGDLRQVDPRVLEEKLGRRARSLRDLAFGLDPRPVVPHRETRSVGEERTFPVDVRDLERLREYVREFSVRLAARLQGQGLSFRTVTVKVRFADFATVTRNRTLEQPATGADEIERLSLPLLERVLRDPRAVRLVGVSVSNLVPAGPVQLGLLPSPDR